MSNTSPGGGSFYPFVKQHLPIIERAEGVYLYDKEGKRYLDAAGGVGGVTSIGHGVPEVLAAMQEQASKVTFIPFYQFGVESTTRLNDYLAELAPGSLKKAMLFNGGSEATENAVKFARQYHLEKGNQGKFKVICRWQGFHGMTLSSTGFGGHTGRRRKFEPMFVDSPHIPPAYCYRCYFEKTFPECNLVCARSLEKAIKWEGPENVAAFIAEPVVGATLGSVPAPEGYFQIVREICDRYDVAFIADEVMTGFGRTGKMFGVEHWGVVPDILVSAKGLGGGYSALSTIIVRQEMVACFERNNSDFVAGHTYCGNPVSAAAGLAVLEYIRRHDLVENSRRQGSYLLERMRELLEYPVVGNVRGLGLMCGLEFVRDKATKEPFPPEARIAHMVAAETRARGVVIYPGTSSADGLVGDHLQLMPPLTLTREQVDEIMGALHAATREAQTKLGIG